MSIALADRRLSVALLRFQELLLWISEYKSLTGKRAGARPILDLSSET
jgi:hypothetical protein